MIIFRESTIKEIYEALKRIDRSKYDYIIFPVLDSIPIRQVKIKLDE